METERKLTGYPSIDKPWLKYYSEEAINAPLPDCTIYETIYNGNKEHLADIALIYFGKKISYKVLFEQIDKTAKAFTACGVKNGDNVALCMPAIPETIYAILALNKIGANANMLNPTFTAEQLTDRINDTGANVLVVINELYNLLETVIPKTSINTVIACPAVNSLGVFAKMAKKVKLIPNTVSWNGFIENGKVAEIVIPPYTTNSPAIMVYSSGTTGASKGIQLTNTGINAAIVECGPYTYGFKRKERYFLQIPVWFSTGIITTGLAPLRYGVCLILEPIYDFDIFDKEILKYKPNYMITATGLVNHMMTKPQLSKIAKHFICLAIGGEGITENAEKRINEWLIESGNPLKLRKGYGMCECCGAVTNTELNCNPLACSGIPTPHVTVSVFDLETGEELKYGERGEIRVLSPCRMLGYYKNPTETAKYFHTDENGNVWACTGDMGYVTEDGCVYVCGRISDSYINEKEETIYLFDIDRAVLDVPEVRQCKTVVSEIKNKKIHVCHITISQDDCADSVIEEVVKHCSIKLAQNHQPYLFKLYYDSLPVAPSGKLDSQKMRRDIEGLFNSRSIER